MAVNKTIFIVEKDKELLSMLGRVLQKEYVIYSFSKADDSFYSLLETVKPDLLILEWLSYFANSDEIIDKVKSRYKDSCKILIITTMQEIKSLISEKTIDGFLMKPFRVDEFKNSINKVLSSQPQDYKHQM